jgi:hypothetical protein
MAAVVKRPYALTGAVAMAAHGYVRPTEDLDVYLLRRHILFWFRAAHAVGLEIADVVDGRHHIAWCRSHADPGIRIDLMFPSSEPLLTGIRKAQRRSVGGLAVNVLSVDLIAGAKALSRDEAHVADVNAMLARGVVSGPALERGIDAWRAHPKPPARALREAPDFEHYDAGRGVVWRTGLRLPF